MVSGQWSVHRGGSQGQRSELVVHKGELLKEDDTCVSFINEIYLQ